MFVADMKRMFNNAKTYNSPDTIYYKCATRWVLLTYFVLTARDGYIPGQSAGNWVTSGFWRFSSWLLYHVHIILPIQSTMPFYLLNGTMSSLNLADTVYASWQTRAENLATLASGYLVFGIHHVTIDFVVFGHAGLKISSRPKLLHWLHKPQPRARLAWVHWTLLSHVVTLLSCIWYSCRLAECSARRWTFSLACSLYFNQEGHWFLAQPGGPTNIDWGDSVVSSTYGWRCFSASLEK